MWRKRRTGTGGRLHEQAAALRGRPAPHRERGGGDNARLERDRVPAHPARPAPGDPGGQELPDPGVGRGQVPVGALGQGGGGRMMGERPIQSRWREGDEDQLLTAGEVWEAVGVSNMTVYRLIKSGDLPAIRLGKTYRVLESEVERYLSGLLVMVEAE